MAAVSTLLTVLSADVTTFALGVLSVEREGGRQKSAARRVLSLDSMLVSC